VSVKLLSKIGGQLIEVHGQNDGRGLLDPSTHLAQLDAYAGHSELLSRCTDHYAAWREASKVFETLESRAAKAADDREFLEHSISELSRLAPKENEEQSLAQSRQFLQVAEGAVSELSQARTALSEAGVAEGQLSSILSSLERLSNKLGTTENAATKALSDASKAIERALLEFQEARGAVDVAANSFDIQPGRGAARKFGVTAAGLSAHRLKLAHELEQLETISADIDAARKLAAKSEQDYHVAADELSKSRVRAATQLDKQVMAELPALKMERAQFLTHIEDGVMSASGRDKVRFVVATNPGSAMGHLDKVASGGEMSRFALSIKVALAGISAPVMVFDEVDQGVGGAVADAIGRRLSGLSANGQVFVVTHSPQVAAKAAQQYRIDKHSDAAMTTTQVMEVTESEREEEIARMLAGEIITDEARAAARKLMQTV